MNTTGEFTIEKNDMILASFLEVKDVNDFVNKSREVTKMCKNATLQIIGGIGQRDELSLLVSPDDWKKDRTQLEKILGKPNHTKTLSCGVTSISSVYDDCQEC
jgi:hypothetical protein